MNERRGTKGLELWCRKMTQGYPGVRIDNMTTSWRDGLAFCAIIHHFRPDLIDFSKLNGDDVFYNNSLAFRVAETHLGIPALLEPEDMVECSSPDRLSILTYLSQFYQAFAVREGASPARVAPKRPQSSADHGIVSPASTSPPTKTAHTGAIVRREPCTKCGLPVFIAERLNIGKQLFHRTCFRCARCASQLTLGNYYETESGEHCCEICPDEEAHPNRNMSDEEQAAQLRYIDSEPDEFSATFETVLENSDAEKVQTLSREFDAARSSFFRNNVLESGDDSSCKEPPDLPESPHPAEGFPTSRDVPDQISCSDNVESRNVVTKESVVRARMRLFENNSKADVNRGVVPLSPNASIPPSIKSVDNNFSKTNENNDNDKDISTKDNQSSITDDVKIEEGTSLSNITNTEKNLLPMPKRDDDLIENSTRAINEAIEDMTSAITSLQDSFQPESDVKEFIQEPFTSLTANSENETPTESVNYDVKITNEIIPKTEEITQTVNYEEELKEEKIHVKAEVVETVNPNVTNENVNCDVQTTTEIEAIKEEKTHITAEVVEAINPNLTDENVNCDVQATTQVTPKIDSTKEETHLTAEVIEAVNPNLTVAAKPVPMARKHPPKLEKTESYPEDLNPFDDEEEAPPKTTSLNPFDEDDEEENVPIRKKLELTPAIKKDMFRHPHGVSRISINPFENADDDEEETPVAPARRKKINVPKSTASNDEDDANKSLLYVQKEFRGSNSSISSGSCYGSARKKRPAPKPPIPAFNDRSNNSSLTSTPSHSVPHSPKPTPKYRKDRRAPPPPPKPNQFAAERRTSINAVKEKLDKDQVNRNLQNIEDAEKLPVQDKSTYGKWKRKKGQAPAKPIPQRRSMKCLPLAEIKKELEFIEVQQQGLERQGVRLEQIIRDKCENESANADDDVPIEVEDLILQLFDLVNEKNELFRKQTELMYLRRQQRLEEEHADIEYQIRCLMMQPDENKTDSEKAREEELIKRLVDIVERRNQIVECLEKDRIREAEEDDTINNHINLYTLNRDNQQQNVSVVPNKKEKKKDKKKEKEKKTKKSKEKLVDADKDIDEKETSNAISDKKKKKKFNLF